jgi:hypothetical protein
MDSWIPKVTTRTVRGKALGCVTGGEWTVGWYKGDYKNGEREGSWVSYYSNGQLRITKVTTEER